MHTGSVLAASALLLAALGCRDDAWSPTEPRAPTPGEVAATTTLAFWQVSAGSEHTCAVTTDSRAYCWGDNIHGELGDGVSRRAVTPVGVAGGLKFRQVTTGFGYSCGVTIEYRAYCWGLNEAGQLGDATTTDRVTPVAVRGGLHFIQISAGAAHTCALSYPDRRAYCWGGNYQGALGDGTTSVRLTPVPVQGARRFRQVSAGRHFTCALTSTYEALCWGYNRFYQLGDGTRISRFSPVRVVGGYQFRQLDAGGGHACAVTTTAQAYCWGWGSSGQLGNGKTFARLRPRPVAGGLSFARLDAGENHTCGHTTQNRAYCWGDNGNAQLGDGTGTFYNRLTPVAVAGGLRFAQLSAGAWHTCGKTPTAVAYCWGDNTNGQLGDGTMGMWRGTPTRVADPL